MPGRIAQVLFGEPKHIGIERGIAEFRAGRPILITGDGGSVVALPVDGLDANRLQAFIAYCSPALPRLALTTARARAMGIDAIRPITLALGAAEAKDILATAASPAIRCAAEPMTAGSPTAAALDIAKLARRLPAALVAGAEPSYAASHGASLVTIEADAVGDFRRAIARSLNVAGEARIPLADGVRTRFVVFCDALGAESVAVIVNAPDFSKPVPVRLHSACLTGDVFGSRRCDCGDQLKLAIAHLAQVGGGIILYLDQEGRGLGLANKMRAYQLQDGGFDTVDANTILGFDDDERDYDAAARMLGILGCARIQLLTNNPAKIDGLRKAGIDISGRIPLVAPVSRENRRYLAAKANRAGHSFDHLMEALRASD